MIFLKVIIKANNITLFLIDNDFDVRQRPATASKRTVGTIFQITNSLITDYILVVNDNCIIIIIKTLLIMTKST